MVSLNILEVKAFMARLFTNTVFDSFILKDLDIQAITGFHISGQLNEGFLTEQELEEREKGTNVLWGDVRNIAFGMIKGNKTPISLRLIFQLPPDKYKEIINVIANRIDTSNIGGMYLNIRFEKGLLHIVTGMAIKIFSPDKTVELECDRWVKEFLSLQGIMYEEA